MMYLNSDFKLIKKNKYIIWSVLGFLFAVLVALFTVTSWFKYDNDISTYFNKAMRFDFFKGWTGYFVLDGYILIISVLVPVGYILLESLYAYLKKKNSDTLGANRYSTIKWFYLIGMIVVPIVEWLLLATYCFDDYGFGTGFIYWFIIDWKFIVPIYVVSGLINMAVFYSLLYFVHSDVAKRDNFLTSGMWQRAIICFIFVLFVYIPVLVMKSGFARPYYWNIHWGDYLNKIKAYDPSRYSHYMNQSEFNYGWHSGSAIDQNFQDTYWPWWKVARGYFDRGTSYYENLPTSDAFPSGHMAAASSIFVAFNFVYFRGSRTKKQTILKWTMLGATLLYGANLFFSLDMSFNHWSSDMAFTLIWAPFAFFIAYAIDRGTTKAVLNLEASEKHLIKL